MYILSISSFAVSWLLICSINSLYSRAERSYWVPYEINDSENYQFRPVEQVPFEKQFRFNVPKSPQYNIYHRDYQHNLVQPKMPSKDINHEIYAKQNAAKSTPEYRIGKQYRSYYDSEPQYIGDRRSHEKGSNVRPSQSEQRFTDDERTQKKDEEIMRKMNELDRLLSEDIENNDIESANTIEDRIVAETRIPEETKRVVRQVRRQRPGFFWTLARLVFETFNDTRSAIQQISNLVGQNFEPDTTPQTPVSSKPLMVADAKTVAPSDDQSNMSSDLAGVNVTTTMTTQRTTTTTETPYKFTQTGVQELIRRNLRGLVRLFNIEWQDALNQSELNVREFQKNLGNQVGSFLQDNPNAF